MASTLAERFAEARRLRGLKVNELDRLANRSSASRVERGERAKLSPEVLADYARALGVRHEWLATGQEPRDPEAVSDLPHSPADRARLAARALGYAPDVIDSALANPPADADARALFRLILDAEHARMAPAQEPKVIGTRKDVAEAGARPPDDALAAEEARQQAEAAQRTTSIQPFGPPETDKPPQGHTANNARLLAAKKKRGER